MPYLKQREELLLLFHWLAGQLHTIIQQTVFSHLAEEPAEATSIMAPAKRKDPSSGSPLV